MICQAAAGEVAHGSLANTFSLVPHFHSWCATGTTRNRSSRFV
jgi:hypothetical protein